MILSPPSLKVSVLALSLGVHLVVLFVWFSSPAIEIAGGAGAVVEARLGNSFADLAEGNAEPPEPKELPPEAPEEITRVQPQETQAQPVETQPQVAAVPEALTSELAAVPVVTPKPVEAIPPDATEVVTAQTVEATKTVAAVAELSSVRPKTRPDQPPEPPRRKKKTQQGNGNQNATAGTAMGSQVAKVAQKSSLAGQSSQAGNAAVSNYPGQVMRKISRIPRPRSRTNGIAVIRFAIAPSGALQSAAIAQSSGSADFDKAALQIVRRAAPFPAPPKGAQRNFSIKIKAKG